MNFKLLFNQSRLFLTMNFLSHYITLLLVFWKALVAKVPWWWSFLLNHCPRWHLILSRGANAVSYFWHQESSFLFKRPSQLASLLFMELQVCKCRKASMFWCWTVNYCEVKQERLIMHNCRQIRRSLQLFVRQWGEGPHLTQLQAEIRMTVDGSWWTIFSPCPRKSLFCPYCLFFFTC